MKTHKIYSFPRVLFVGGIFALYVGSVNAQGQTGKQPASSSSHTQNQTAVEKNNTRMNTSSSADKAMHNSIRDDMFIKKASESNLAVIELSRMALKQASSEKVKEFAQMMVDHHTAAQIELSSALSKSKAVQATQNTSGRMSNDANDKTGIESENNDADKLATLGGTGGTTGNSMGKGKTNGQYNSNVDTGDSIRVDSKADDNTDTIGITSGSGNSISNSGSMNQNPSMENGYLPTELSAHHEALKNKLSILSGAEFDREYMQAMVEDHAKSVELYEKQALQSKDTNLQSFASKNLPLIKEHYQMAQKLSNKKDTGSNSSGNKTSNN